MVNIIGDMPRWEKLLNDVLSGKHLMEGDEMEVYETEINDKGDESK